MAPVNYLAVLLTRSRLEGDCIVWTGSLDKDGYGRLGKGLAHRCSYAQFVGEIPAGMTVDHVCFRRACINPLHLQLLTRKQNSTRQRSAMSSTCGNGHERTPENVYFWWNGKRYMRFCRPCNAINAAKTKERRK